MATSPAPAALLLEPRGSRVLDGIQDVVLFTKPCQAGTPPSKTVSLTALGSLQLAAPGYPQRVFVCPARGCHGAAEGGTNRACSKHAGKSMADQTLYTTTNGTRQEVFVRGAGNIKAQNPHGKPARMSERGRLREPESKSMQPGPEAMAAPREANLLRKSRLGQGIEGPREQARISGTASQLRQSAGDQQRHCDGPVGLTGQRCYGGRQAIRNDVLTPDACISGERHRTARSGRQRALLGSGATCFVSAAARGSAWSEGQRRSSPSVHKQAGARKEKSGQAQTTEERHRAQRTRPARSWQTKEETAPAAA